MKRILVVVPFLLALSACGFDKPPPANEQKPDSEKAATAAPKLPAKDDQENGAKKRLDTFAAQLAENGKGYVQFNRIRDAKKGGKERQIFVEMVGMTDQQAADAAAKTMQQLGYKQGRRWGDKNGVRISFSDTKKVPINVLVRSREAHPKLKHADATSSVYLTMPVGK